MNSTQIWMIVVSLLCIWLASDHVFVAGSESEDLLECTQTTKPWKIDCDDGHEYNIEKKSSNIWKILLEIAISAFLVLFAGLMSGLTMGLMSLDTTNLMIIAKSGDPVAQKHAETILPLVRKHHLLLVTLLVGNALAMEALPIFLNKLVGPFLAVIISVTILLFFGEVIPMAICTRYGLAIGANMAWLVWILIVLFFVVSYPVSKLLDCILGHDSGTYYRRSELKELVGIHGSEEDENERLTKDEINIIQGALDMKGKTAGSVVTPLHRVSMLDYNGTFDEKTCKRLVQEGHSRWPVYKGERDNIVGMILVKNLLMLNRKSNTPVSSLPIVKLPEISENQPLYQVLDFFQQGSSHMALVVDGHDGVTKRGIITLEDIVEELIGEEILDETDVFEDVADNVRVVRAFKNELNPQRQKPSKKDASASDSLLSDFASI